jgi:hypothetical protein
MIYTKLYDLNNIELDDDYFKKAKSRVIDAVIEKNAAEEVYASALAYKARHELLALKIQNGSIFEVDFKDVGLVSFKFISIDSCASSDYSYRPKITATRKLKSGKWAKSSELIPVDDNFPAWVSIPPTELANKAKT